MTDDQRPVYSVWHRDSLLLEDSKLGIILKDADLSTGLSLEEVTDAEIVSERYEMLQGKRLERAYEAREKTYILNNAAGDKLEIIFRVSDDGVAFRYHLPEASEEPKQISRELSSFNLREGAIGWLQPMAVAKTGFAGTNPSYEEHYQNAIEAGAPAPTEAGWVFPAFFSREKAGC